IGQAPTGMQSFMEPIIMFIRDDIAKPSIGDKYEKFMPYLLTLFFFIWINNVMGLIPLIPGGTNLTGNIAIPIVLALFTFVLTTINGNAHYWKHIFVMPGVPKPILLILTPLEVVGIFIKPIVLVIRLFANITAGHIVMLVFFSLIFIFGETSVAAGYGVSVASVAFTVFLTFLELLVGVIQAYVFTLLSAIYFGMATAGGDH
ncbi:MAG: F0F1 ATP synthase subunit A, partial [Flavobacteriales bacterium]|nr:F0F1 ATP synthase subunit A [Flavobacteriales bacterium]